MESSHIIYTELFSIYANDEIYSPDHYLLIIHLILRWYGGIFYVSNICIAVYLFIYHYISILVIV